MMKKNRLSPILIQFLFVMTCTNIGDCGSYSNKKYAFRMTFVVKSVRKKIVAELAQENCLVLMSSDLLISKCRDVDFCTGPV